jgi:hypothetical protein
MTVLHNTWQRGTAGGMGEACRTIQHMIDSNPRSKRCAALPLVVFSSSYLSVCSSTADARCTWQGQQELWRQMTVLHNTQQHTTRGMGEVCRTIQHMMDGKPGGKQCASLNSVLLSFVFICLLLMC